MFLTLSGTSRVITGICKRNLSVLFGPDECTGRYIGRDDKHERSYASAYHALKHLLFFFSPWPCSHNFGVMTSMVLTLSIATRGSHSNNGGERKKRKRGENATRMLDSRPCTQATQGWRSIITFKTNWDKWGTMVVMPKGRFSQNFMRMCMRRLADVSLWQFVFSWECVSDGAVHRKGSECS